MQFGSLLLFFMVIYLDTNLIIIQFRMLRTSHALPLLLDITQLQRASKYK